MTLRVGPISGAALALTMLGCASAPSGGVPLESNEWGEYSLTVEDASGLVTAVRGADGPPGAPDGAVALPEQREVQLRWIGGACSHRPVLEVSGSSDDLRLAISNPPDPQPLPFLPISCPAVGVPLGAVLTLSEPVDQDAIGLEVTY